MTSFSSLLSSISGQSAPPQSKPAGQRKPNGSSDTAGLQTASMGAGDEKRNLTAGVKRKREDNAVTSDAKTVKREGKVAARPLGEANSQRSVSKPATFNAAPASSYHGTARPTGGIKSGTQKLKPASKTEPICMPAVVRSTPAGSEKPKRGFASILEKAKAAQEAAKAAGSSTIKHKPTERFAKRERSRIRGDAVTKQKPVAKHSSSAVKHESRSNTSADVKGAAPKISTASTYTGTMKKSVEKQQYAYKGTMNKANSSVVRQKQGAKKQLAQDKYGGYASWSDLDDAEDDEEEEVYESDASSDMMDAGFGDMEREENEALKAARKEDQEALEEEERHQREKMERKRKLEALSKNAGARRKF